MMARASRKGGDDDTAKNRRQIALTRRAVRWPPRPGTATLPHPLL